MALRRQLIRLHRTLWGFGLDPVRMMRAIWGLPGFVRDLRRFRSCYGGPLILSPCLGDRFEEGGATTSEYFWQDLLVARLICQASAERHVDIGSRVDGFVAHVASFRQVEVIDIRPVSARIPGVTFRRADVMDAGSLGAFSAAGGYCDSLSCLHALEHFGLGRYGDPVDPQGFERGFRNMASLVKVGGSLYLSTPVGRERVEFNANRVFDPRTILRLAGESHLLLDTLTVIEPVGGIDLVEVNEESLRALADKDYGLGVFVFRKA